MILTTAYKYNKISSSSKQLYWNLVYTAVEVFPGLINVFFHSPIRSLDPAL